MFVDALKRACLALLTLGLLHLQPPLSAAQSARPRVVWVVPSAALRTAAQKAFEPTQIELISATEALRVAQLGAAFDPRRLARDHAAGAVVWTNVDGQNSALYVYDAQLDGIVGTRGLPEAPLNAATAAAIVLSVKTYLGQGAAAGALEEPQAADASLGAAAIGSSETQSDERVGHVNEESSAAGSAPPAAAMHEKAADERAGPALQGPARATPERDRAAEAALPEPSERSQLQLELAASGGARLAMHKLGPELRYGLSAQLREADAAWGVMLALSAGSGFRTQRTQLYEPAAALLGVWNGLRTSRWRIAFVAGPALHWLLVDVESARSAQRLRPHIYAGLSVSWYAPAGWFVGAEANADVPLVSQRYWVNEQLEVEGRALGASALLRAGAPLSF